MIGEQGTLWLSTEAEIGLFDTTIRIAEAANAFSMPMAQRSAETGLHPVSSRSHKRRDYRTVAVCES